MVFLPNWGNAHESALLCSLITSVCEGLYEAPRDTGMLSVFRRKALDMNLPEERVSRDRENVTPIWGKRDRENVIPVLYHFIMPNFRKDRFPSFFQRAHAQDSFCSFFSRNDPEKVCGL